MNDQTTEPSFREEQRFRQVWVWLLVLLVSLVLVGVFGWAMVSQLILGIPWTSDPLPDAGLLVLGSLMIALGLAMPWLFFSMRLITEVRADGVRIRYFPFVRRTIRFKDIARCEARTYRPIWEYGGWGIRWSLGKGMAYNVSGNRGVQLELTNRKRLLIGSQDAEEMARAIQENMRHD